MQKVQNRRVPSRKFSFRNSDEYWLCESSYNIKHSEDLFFGASVAPKGIIYPFILLIPPHHHHFLQLFSFWCRLMVVLSLSPRPRSVPLFQPNEDGCSGKTVQMYVLAAGDRHRTICKNKYGRRSGLIARWALGHAGIAIFFFFFFFWWESLM